MLVLNEYEWKAIKKSLDCFISLLSYKFDVRNLFISKFYFISFTVLIVVVIVIIVVVVLWWITIIVLWLQIILEEKVVKKNKK